jgi:hypothetical protein
MRGLIQLWAGLLLLVGGVSYPIAYAGERFLHLKFIVTFIATALALLLGIVGVYRHVRRKEAGSSEVIEFHIEAIDTSEAAKAAKVILSDPSKFVVVMRHADSFPFAKDLADHVRGFFDEIESLKAVRGDAELDRHSIERSKLNPDYIRIGLDIESVEICVRAGDETIYEIDVFDPSKPFDRHRSIYHWVLAVDHALYGD